MFYEGDNLDVGKLFLNDSANIQKAILSQRLSKCLVKSYFSINDKNQSLFFFDERKSELKMLLYSVFYDNIWK